ncbi:MAG: rRNA (guanine527-N7)-methyltransferase [Clostridia bacterium]|nr:rRNA (guanine527-N7)-methyltransferase [Clostridia bacterium]
MPVNSQIIETFIQNTGIEITNDKQLKLRNYIDLLMEYNKKFNLTNITEEGEIWRKHVIDSLLIFYYLKIPNRISMLDVGTGAGIPGLVLKICRPDLKITLLESQKKKVNFLNLVIDKLGLNDVSCIWDRAEKLGHDLKYREKFDMVVARGVASLNILAEYCLPFVKIDGLMVAYKGPKAKTELSEAKNAINLLGGNEVILKEYKLPEGDDDRSLIIIKKDTMTPSKYPRRPGIAFKRPIK